MFGAEAIFPALLLYAIGIALFVVSLVGAVVGVAVVRRARKLGGILIASSILCGGTLLGAYVGLQKDRPEYEIAADLRNGHDRSWLPQGVSEWTNGSSRHFALSGVIVFSFLLPDGEDIEGKANNLFVEYTENKLRSVGVWLEEPRSRAELDEQIDALAKKWGEESVDPSDIESLQRWLVVPSAGDNSLAFLRNGYLVRVRISASQPTDEYRVYYGLEFES